MGIIYVIVGDANEDNVSDIREELIAFLDCHGEEFAAIRQEKNNLIVHFYDSKIEKDIEFEDLINALNDAKERIYLTSAQACFITMDRINSAILGAVDDGKDIFSIKCVRDGLANYLLDYEQHCPDGVDYIFEQSQIRCPIHGSIEDMLKVIEQENSDYEKKLRKSLSGFHSIFFNK